MSTEDAARAALIEQVNAELSELRQAADRLDEVVAAQFGLNRTDLRCLGILYRRGRVTAGELADESGLTPGAITTVLDRMERGGYANRVADPSDRRRVYVVSTAATREVGARVYGEVEVAGNGELEGHSVDELTQIRDYLRRMREVYESQAAHVARQAAEAAGSAGPTAAQSTTASGDPDLSAPLDGVTAGRLEFTKGAAKVKLRGDPALTELYRASFEGPAPEITVIGGTVTVQQRRRFRPFDWRAQSADFALATTVPWEVSLRGGMWQLIADLRDIRLSSLEVAGGASDILITLPRPAGTVPLRISGGASDVTLRRPKGTEARAEVTGGASQLTFDEQRLGAVGDRAVFASGGFSEAADRYEIRFTGGASQVTVTTV